MANLKAATKSDDELKLFILNVLSGKYPTDYLHDETPIYKVYNLYKSEDDVLQKKRIEGCILSILKEMFVQQVRTELDEELDTFLGNLAFLVESLRINEAYIFLRSLMDRGTLSPAKRYFYSKEVERKILRSLIVLQPPSILSDTIWKSYWEADDPFFWEIAFNGLRRSNIDLAIECLRLACQRWMFDKKSFDLPQTLYYMMSQEIDEDRIQRIMESLEALSNEQKEELRSLLKAKGLQESKIANLLPDKPPGIKVNDQLSVVLSNAPRELAKLCEVLKETNVKILAISIQNAKDSVKELYNMKQKTGKRIALAESYKAILQDPSDYSLVRLLVDRPVEAERALLKANHLVSTEPILVFRLVNQPGALNRVMKRFDEAKLNIDYVYSTTTEVARESIFVVHIEEVDLDRVNKLFEDV
jgi:hypothetical protein